MSDLLELALTTPLNDPEILKLSQELDVLIVKYQRLIQKK